MTEQDTIKRLIHVCAYVSKVQASEMYSHSRRSVLILPRQVVSYIGVRMMGKTTTEVARIMKRDHSTVVHGVGKIEQRLRDQCPKTTPLVDQVWKTYQDRIHIPEEINEVANMDKPAAPAVPSKEVCEEIKKLRAKGMPVNRIAERVQADEFFVARMCGVSFWKGKHTNEVTT